MNTNNFTPFASSSILISTFPEYHLTPRGRIVKLDKRPALLDYSFEEFCEMADKSRQASTLRD